MTHTLLTKPLLCRCSKSAIICFLLLTVLLSSARAKDSANDIFSLLNLDYPGLEQVKALHKAGEEDKAAQALLDYYHHRKGIVNPAIDLNNLSISKREQKWADEALEHTFYVHDGYQPSFNYGKDINWQYWPVQDLSLIHI